MLRADFHGIVACTLLLRSLLSALILPSRFAIATRRRSPCATGGTEENSYEEMSMEEIMCGKGDHFPGLIPIVYAYLDLIKCDSITMERVQQYLELIELRARGKLKTPATWTREFVTQHPDYKKDSVVSEKIARDYIMACKDIGEGMRHEPSLTGDVVIDPITPSGAYDIKMDARRIKNKQVLKLLQRFMKRSSFSEGMKK